MIEESERRCPWDSKRMMKEVDPFYFGAGTRWVHTCWTCDYSFAQIEPSKPTLRVIAGGRSGADRLKRVRLGGGHAG